MPKQQEEKQPKESDNRQREQQHTRIGQQVIGTLGQPGDLIRVQVRPLWGDYYRVNVLVGVDAASARVAHSFFLQADGDGKILTAVPKVMRRY